MGSHSCRFLCSFSLSHAPSLPSLLSPPYTLFLRSLHLSLSFCRPPPVYCISPVSSSWPFATLLCQSGIWNQPFFISSDLCLSFILLPCLSYTAYLFPLPPTFLFILLCSFISTLYTSSCFICSSFVCPSPLFSISCLSQVSSCFLLIFFFSHSFLIAPYTFSLETN